MTNAQQFQLKNMRICLRESQTQYTRLRELCKNLHGLAQQWFLRWSVGWAFKCKIQILTAFINKSHWYPTCEKSLTLYIKCSYYLFLGIRHKPQVMGRLLGLEPHFNQNLPQCLILECRHTIPQCTSSINYDKFVPVFIFQLWTFTREWLQNSASQLKPFVRSYAPVTLM